MPPRLARLLAVLAALVLVAGAFAARAALRDDDTSASGPGPDRSSGDDASPYRILCDEDLGPACAALAQGSPDDVVDVVPAEEAVARLSGKGDLAYDAWLTLDPWPEMLAFAAEADPPLAVTAPEALASTPLAVLVDPATSDCAGATDWACLTGPADPPVGVPDPATALGALVLAHAAAGLQGDVEFGTNQLRDEVRSALSDLLGALGPNRRLPGAEQLQALLQPGPLSAVVAPEGQARSTADTPQGQNRDLVVASLAPRATIGVVLVGTGPRGDRALEVFRDLASDQTVAQALAGAGWSDPPGRTTGLPGPDVIYSLQEALA